MDSVEWNLIDLGNGLSGYRHPRFDVFHRGKTDGNIRCSPFAHVTMQRPGEVERSQTRFARTIKNFLKIGKYRQPPMGRSFLALML